MVVVVSVSENCVCACVCVEQKNKRTEREQINCGILPVSPMDSISKYLHCYVCSIMDAYSVFSLCQSDCYQGNLRCLCVFVSVCVCVCMCECAFVWVIYSVRWILSILLAI